MYKLTKANKRAIAIIMRHGGIAYSSMLSEGYGKYRRNAAAGLERGWYVTICSRSLLPAQYLDNPVVAKSKGQTFYVATDTMRMYHTLHTLYHSHISTNYGVPEHA